MISLEEQCEERIFEPFSDEPSPSTPLDGPPSPKRLCVGMYVSTYVRTYTLLGKLECVRIHAGSTGVGTAEQPGTKATSKSLKEQEEKRAREQEEKRA